MSRAGMMSERDYCWIALSLDMDIEIGLIGGGSAERPPTADRRPPDLYSVEAYDLPAKSTNRFLFSILNFFPPNRGVDFYFELLPANRQMRDEPASA